MYTLSLSTIHNRVKQAKQELQPTVTGCVEIENVMRLRSRRFFALLRLSAFPLSGIVAAKRVFGIYWFLLLARPPKLAYAYYALG